MNQFLHYLKYKRPLIFDRIEEILYESAKSQSFVNKWGEDIITKLLPFMKKGKLVRGALSIFSYESFKTTNNDLFALDLASALEIFHAGLLIHDDIMDKDLLRRGQNSIHSLYIKRAKSLHISEDTRFGESMGICLGDLCFFIAFEIISKLPNTSFILEIISRELAKVAIAQMQDTYFGLSDNEATYEDIFSTYMHKTARYTFSLPLVSGALLNNPNSNDLRDLENLGDALGLIYQIKDDEIGLFGDELNTGKTKASDIRENKKTLLRFYLFKNADKELLSILKKSFGNKNISEKEIKSLQIAVKKSGILIHIQNTVNLYHLKAVKIIKDLGIEDTYKKILLDLTEYNLTRTN